MRKSAIISLVVCMVVNLTGCWSNREVNDIAIVLATGLDLTKEGNLRLSLLLAIPQLIGTTTTPGVGSTQLASSAGWVVAEEGSTVLEALRHLQRKLPRKVFFSHNRVIIIGKRLADRGVVQALDFFQRYRQSQLKSFLAVSETTAVELLEYKPKFENLASEVIVDEFSQRVFPSVRLVEFLNALQSPGVEPFVPILSIIPSHKGPGNENNLSVSAIAVFKKDRMIGKLDDNMSRGLLWILDLLKEGVITIDVEHPERSGKISAELEKANMTRRIEVNGEQVRMRLKAKVTANIYENTSGMDLEDPENTRQAIRGLKQDIKERIQSTVDYVQNELRSDIFGYGQTLYRARPSLWNHQYRDRWEAVFPIVESVVDVDVRVLRNGLTNETVKIKEVNP